MASKRSNRAVCIAFEIRRIAPSLKLNPEIQTPFFRDAQMQKDG